MRPKMIACAAAVAASVLAVPCTASATSASATLTGLNGEGTYNASLPCGAGDGANWRYGWIHQIATSASGILGGQWDGTFEVHDAGAGQAFIPNGDGRIALQVNRGGTGYFETRGNGSCNNAVLNLTTTLAGDPVAQGTLPIVATGGLGALSGLTGSGVATLDLTLGAGADNTATISLNGNFDVTAPQLSATGVTTRWENLASFLAHKLQVSVTVANASSAGVALEAKISGASGATGTFGGLPTASGTIAPGASRAYVFTMNNAQAGKTYTVNLTMASKDGLLAQQPPASGSVTFKTPALP